MNTMSNHAHFKQNLKELSEVDIRTVDPNELVDISTVTIDRLLPKEERIDDFIRQIKNPYCYLSHGVTVKISFSGTRSLEDCIASCISIESPLPEQQPEPKPAKVYNSNRAPIQYEDDIDMAG